MMEVDNGPGWTGLLVIMSANRIVYIVYNVCMCTLFLYKHNIHVNNIIFARKEHMWSFYLFSLSSCNQYEIVHNVRCVYFNNSGGSTYNQIREIALL